MNYSCPCSSLCGGGGSLGGLALRSRGGTLVRLFMVRSGQVCVCSPLRVHLQHVSSRAVLRVDARHALPVCLTVLVVRGSSHVHLRCLIRVQGRQL